MNILHVTLGFYPATAWGGPVKFVHRNALELMSRGHRVTVYCTNLLDKTRKLEPGTSEHEVDHIRVVYFDTWRVPQWPGTLGPIWLPDMSRYLKRELSGFDVVHLNGYRNPMLLSASRAARHHGVPFVVQPHGAIPVIVNTFVLKRLYDRFLGKHELLGLSALVALQASERQQALSLGVPDERIVEIPVGTQVPDLNLLPPQDAFRRKYGIPVGLPLVLFLGRINLKKGADMLVEAFARMQAREPVLVIAGPDDGQLAEVQSQVDRYDLSDRVHFTGLIDGSDIWSAYRDADLFVLPCRADTFPMTIVEACAMGTPILTTTGCEIAHLVDGKIGDVVAFDAGQFARAMDEMLSDDARRARYASNTQLMMQDTFSVEAAVDRLERVYQAVVDGYLPGRYL